MKKVILISIDGMRPDAFLQCGNPYISTMMSEWAYTLSGRTVVPSVTLPCHLSMFYSVPPSRHGITTNDFMPFARPLNGIFDQLKQAGKTCASFYAWDEMRDLGRPGSVKILGYRNAWLDENSDEVITDMALECMKKDAPDFVFLYLGDTDEKGGHGFGWMSEEYLKYISVALDCVKKVAETCPEYEIIVTADHGGHDRTHGTESDEDMTIPQFYLCEGLSGGEVLSDVSILDVPPTVAELLGVDAVEEWEGKSVLKK